jgi:hypothetical protein
VKTAHEVLLALARRYAFGEVAALVAEGAAGAELDGRDGELIEQLCAFGQRLLDLDAEDFGRPDALPGAGAVPGFADEVAGERVPEELVDRAHACRMPQHPEERVRGALGSMRPAFRLLLEVIAARWHRHETAALVAAIHITSEYLPLLIWEQVLGHAGDPARIRADVTGEACLWGAFEDRECPHTKPEKSAAAHIIRVSGEPVIAWQNYLDRQHSNISHAFAVCAADCRRPCDVFCRYTGEQRAMLTDRCKTALTYVESPIVRLRHAAPVGHGFGVPSTAEVLTAWGWTRTSIGKHQPAVSVEDGFPLPGLPSLFTALAGVPIAPDTLLADTSTALIDALG